MQALVSLSEQGGTITNEGELRFPLVAPSRFTGYIAVYAADVILSMQDLASVRRMVSLMCYNREVRKCAIWY